MTDRTIYEMRLVICETPRWTLVKLVDNSLRWVPTEEIQEAE